MKVLKFGGTSVGSVNAVRQVGEIIKRKIEKDQLVVVVSAFSGVTNRLEDLCQEASSGNKQYLDTLEELAEQHNDVYKQLVATQDNGFITEQLEYLREVCDGIYLLKELTQKSSDYVMSFGERMSSYIIAQYFQTLFPTRLFDSRQYIIVDSEYGQNVVDHKKSSLAISEAGTFEQVNLFPGFIASNKEGITTTLGRGGSDYTAALLANYLEAEELEIWTDVSGIMSADPNLVRQAKVIPHLSYEEAMELSHFGAKVIYPPSIQPALSKEIPIKIKNTFSPEDEGTLVTKEWDEDKQLIRGISSIKNVVLINLTGAGMVGIPSFSHRFFGALAGEGVNVILITQASSEHSICAAISASELKGAIRALKKEFGHEIRDNRISEIEVEKDLAIMALVGSNMRHQVGVSGQMFHTLGKNGISVKAIAQGSSERNISAVVPLNYLKKALNVLHEGFFLSSLRRINLFVIGIGNVGKAFIEQVQKQKTYLLDKHHTRIEIVGIANSRKMIFDEEGLALSDLPGQLERGAKFSTASFIKQMNALNIRNSIFIDITGSEEIANVYQDVLSNSISVVTPNKIAATASYSNYLALNDTARRANIHFLIETNVCAGLPVISTLSDLIRSGDEIHQIKAVLSGTLNYLFNTYDGSKPFVDVIKEAKSLGLTEPDPRLDLFGEDVKRKILILARESGHAMEMEQVALESFLPKSCHDAADIEAFYDEVAGHESHFRNLYEDAHEAAKKLRVVATFNAKESVAKVALEAVSEDHPFFHLEGMDNIVLFYSSRYAKQPLVVKGAGAGAAVTASGIFGDILKVSLH